MLRATPTFGPRPRELITITSALLHRIGRRDDLVDGYTRDALERVGDAGGIRHIGRVAQRNSLSSISTL